MKSRMTMQLIVVGCLLTIAHGFHFEPVVSYGYDSPYGYAFDAPFGAPLAVLADAPFAAETPVRVPLLAVAADMLPLIPSPHVRSPSQHVPYITCQQNDRFIEAMPAVRVVLEHPILLSGPEATVVFPSRVQAIHEGVRYTIPVGALIAPVPEPAFGHHILRVVYAVPDIPIVHEHPAIPNLSILPNRIGPVTSEGKPHKVTVLDFPEEVSSPPVTSYQPTSEDDLADRNPPERVVPAGIVQSAQPTPSVQSFVNSKESPHLQKFRDQAQKQRDSRPGVEAL